MMSIDEFAKIDLTKEEHTEKPNIILRVSHRLMTVFPPNTTRAYYIRRAIELMYFIRNSPCRIEILSHLGYDTDLNFDYNHFLTNYTKEYLINILGNITKPLNLVEPKPEIDPATKKAMREIFDEMWDLLPKKEQDKLMTKYERSIPKMMEVMK